MQKGLRFFAVLFSMKKVLSYKENVGYLLFGILILLADLHPPAEKA